MNLNRAASIVMTLNPPTQRALMARMVETCPTCRAIEGGPQAPCPACCGRIMRLTSLHAVEEFLGQPA